MIDNKKNVNVTLSIAEIELILESLKIMEAEYDIDNFEEETTKKLKNLLISLKQ